MDKKAQDDRDLHSIRLETRSIWNQLEFLQESLQGLARDSVEGRQLYPIAIRGLIQHLSALSDRASGASYAACRILGIDEDISEEEFQ